MCRSSVRYLVNMLGGNRTSRDARYGFGWFGPRDPGILTWTVSRCRLPGCLHVSLPNLREGSCLPGSRKLFMSHVRARVIYLEGLADTRFDRLRDWNPPHHRPHLALRRYAGSIERFRIRWRLRCRCWTPTYRLIEPGCYSSRILGWSVGSRRDCSSSFSSFVHHTLWTFVLPLRPRHWSLYEESNLLGPSYAKYSTLVETQARVNNNASA